MKIAQGLVWRQHLSILALMTLGGAVNAGFTSVGNLGDGGMAGDAAKLAMRRAEILSLVDVEHFKTARFFRFNQSWVLMTGKAAAIVQGLAGTRHHKN